MLKNYSFLTLCFISNTDHSFVLHPSFEQVEVYDKRIAAVREEEEGLHKDTNALLASRLQLESFQNVKYAPVIADLNERIQKVEGKLQILRERRIEIKMTVDYCNHFTDEGKLRA